MKRIISMFLAVLLVVSVFSVSATSAFASYETNDDIKKESEEIIIPDYNGDLSESSAENETAESSVTEQAESTTVTTEPAESVSETYTTESTSSADTENTTTTAVTDPSEESVVNEPSESESPVPSQPESSESSATGTAATSTQIYIDGRKDLPYMIIGESYYIADYVKDADEYRWHLTSDGCVEFDGEKIIAKQLGEAKLVGFAHGTMWVMEFYIKVIEYAPVKITLRTDETYTIPVGLYRSFTWNIENEDIITFNEKATIPNEEKIIIPKAEGKTCLQGTTPYGGKYTFEFTVVGAKEQEVHKHTNKVINKKSATYFKKGYTGDTVCKTCGKVIKKGKAVSKLKLKMPEFKLKGRKKKFTVKYTKVKDATGFQVKYKVGNKSYTKTYKTKKSVNKVIRCSKKGTYKVYVRAFVKKGKSIAYSSWSSAKKVKVK